jgi:hypothetical protein
LTPGLARCEPQRVSLVFEGLRTDWRFRAEVSHNEGAEQPLKVCITTEINLETGDYEVRVKNLSHPGVGVDLNDLRKAWRKVYEHLAGKIRETCDEVPN